MLEIKETLIEARYGEERSFLLSFKNYTFQVDDKIQFRVYKARGLHKSMVIDKKITIKEETQKVRIVLSEEDMTIGPILNQTVDYWYEIKLNDRKFPIAYDAKGAKIFRVFPRGADNNAGTV